MSEFDEMTIAMAVGVLLLLAMIGGFMLMWQRQKYLHAALKLAWTSHSAGMTPEQILPAQGIVNALRTGSEVSPVMGVPVKLQIPLEERESGINPAVQVNAPLSESPGSKSEKYRKGSEEDRLRAMLAGRTTVRSSEASPLQRPGSP